MKKIFCLIFTLVLSFGSFGNVFAATPDIKGSKSGDMESDIQNEIEIARKEIYRQLEEQDALILMEVYEDIIYPQIEKQIRAEYRGEVNPFIEERASYYYAPKGGMVTYLTPISGYKPTEVAVTCLDRDKSYDYFLNKYSFSLSSVLSTILGYIPDLGDVSGMILDIKGIADSLAISNVKNADGCAQIINTYSREWGTKASLLTGWSDRYNIYVPSNATNVTFSRF